MFRRHTFRLIFRDRFFFFYVKKENTVKTVLRGHHWDKEKLAL
jgi:hypothetical protein